MKQTNKLGGKILGSITKLAVKSATQSANAACPWWNHQSKLPEAVKKLRKF